MNGLKQIPAETDVRLLEYLSSNELLSNDVHEQAKIRLKEVRMPQGASQEEIYRAAVSDPALRENALERLTDEELLCDGVISKVLSLSAIDKIHNPRHLSRIASDPAVSPQARAKAAKAANLWNPFGDRTIVCPKCGKAAVYQSDFESIDSYQTVSTLSGEACGIRKDAKTAMNTFLIGSDKTANLRDKIVFICPKCGPGKQCRCQPKPAPVPVIFASDSYSGDVNQ